MDTTPTIKVVDGTSFTVLENSQPMTLIEATAKRDFHQQSIDAETARIAELKSSIDGINADISNRQKNIDDDSYQFKYWQAIIDQASAQGVIAVVPTPTPVAPAQPI